MTMEQILYIVLAILGGLIVLFLLLFPIVKRVIFFRHFTYFYGKKIYKIALNFDFYLINDFILRPDDDKAIHIDHILFGDKYIYCIKDRFYRGAIEGNEMDKSWYFYPKLFEKRYIDNPLLKNKERVQRFSYATNIDPKMMISIVVVNDDCLLFPFEVRAKDSYLVPLSKLNRLIKNIEKRDVAKIDTKQLQYVVNDLARMKQRNKN